MLTIALISEHASPLAQPGGVDSGGQNVYVGHLARALARLGCKVDIFTRRDHPQQAAIVAWYPGVRVIHVPAGPPVFLPKEKLLRWMPEFARFMLQFMQEYAPQYALSHANFFMSGMVARSLKKVAGLPFVITFHALGRVRRREQGDADTFPDERIDIEEWLIRDADCVIAECAQDETDIRSLYLNEPNALSVIPCGVDPIEFRPERDTARAKLGMPSDEFIVLQLGRMVPRKGIDNVIRAMARLHDYHRLKARLLVVGGDVGDPGKIFEIRRLALLAHTLGIESQVQFTGGQPRSVLRTYYSAADVFVTTPWYEPFGITPLEAMACATPVIGSAVGGIKSTLIEGETGFLVPPDAPEVLADRLVQLYQDPALARRLGRNGLRRARQHFSWDQVATQMMQVYQSVHRNRPLSSSCSTVRSSENSLNDRLY